MKKHMSLPVFLARPMRTMKLLDASFFNKVENRLIRPALKIAGHTNKYCFNIHVGAPMASIEMLNDILAHIQAAHLCIFDITGFNENVLIEYGYRRALWNTHLVVLACRDVTNPDDLPFDLRHQNVLFYDKADIDHISPRLVESLRARISEALQPLWHEQPLVNTDHVYMRYRDLTPKDDLLIWVATWPAFPNSFKEKILETCRARSIVIAGPVTGYIHLPGIFWRLDIRERRTKHKLGPFHIYGQDLPDLKIIAAGHHCFLASEAAGRTIRYYQLGHTSIQLNSVAEANLVGARVIEEVVYRFLLARLQQRPERTLDSTDIIRAFDEELQTTPSSSEIAEYDTKWILAGIRKWIPRCIQWTEKNRGWTALRLHNKPGNDFGISLEKRGAWLTQPHYLHLASPHDIYTISTKRQEGALPRLRIVVTNRCGLGCSYCPPENEDYPGISGHHTLSAHEIGFVLRAAHRAGFNKFSLTGGEPLRNDETASAVIDALKAFAKEYNIQEPKSFAIQTNGQYLHRYLGELQTIAPSTILKISIDALQTDDQVAKSMIASDVLQTVENARKRGFDVGINFTLTRANAKFLFEVAKRAQSIGVYLKILDLNWYEDLGRRHKGLGAQQNTPQGDLYWDKYYLSPIEYYRNELQPSFGPLVEVSSAYGIPMPQTRTDAKGFFIRIKDSCLGSHYASDCRRCPFFVDKRRCQEGVYQPWITPALRMKLCRHREDVYADLADSIHNGNDQETADIMRCMVDQFYAAAALAPF